jgi:hypothetical protein
MAHRLIGFPDGKMYLQLGSFASPWFLDAVTRIERESYENPIWEGVKDGGTTLAWVVVREGATDWAEYDGQVFNVAPNQAPDAVPALNDNIEGSFNWGISGAVSTGDFNIPQEAAGDIEFREVRIAVDTAPTTQSVDVNISLTPFSGGGPSNVLSSDVSIGVGQTMAASALFAINTAEVSDSFQPVVVQTDASATNLRVYLRVFSKARNNP